MGPTICASPPSGARSPRNGHGWPMASVPSCHIESDAMSNWADVLRALIDSLVCPKCHAANRPGAHIIEFEDGRALCGVCSHHWILKQGD